jgi:uncharacterized protein (DUF2249 family)
MSHECTCSPSTTAAYGFDARGVDRRFRHAAIFGALESLHPGETMRFTNDHDPLPLIAQLNNYFGPRIKVDYVARQPAEIIIDFTVTA